MNERQFEIPANNHYISNIHISERLSDLDYVHFIWPPGFNPNNYIVAIDSLDTAGPSHKGIGYLNQHQSPYKSSLFIPQVKLAWHTTITVLPKSTKEPSFYGKLSRGATYMIPENSSLSYPNKLEQFGMDRPHIL